MAGITSGSFDQPDETRTPDKATVAVIRLGSQVVARITFQPGWRWSASIKPIVGTDSCQVRHIGAITSGRLHALHQDGSEVETGTGCGLRHRARA